jgi:hypothetical protein
MIHELPMRRPFLQCRRDPAPRLFHHAEPEVVGAADIPLLSKMGTRALFS